MFWMRSTNPLHAKLSLSSPTFMDVNIFKVEILNQGDTESHEGSLKIVTLFNQVLIFRVWPRHVYFLNCSKKLYPGLWTTEK